MGKRRKWYMVGPTYNQSSGSWLFRKATPTDLKNRKADLKALGIKYKGEWHRAYKARDKYEALEIYREIEQEVELEWQRWRLALASGASLPQSLSHKQAMALTGKGARATLSRLEDNPQDAYNWSRVIFLYIVDVIVQHIGSTLEEKQSALAYLNHLKSLPTVALPKEISKASEGSEEPILHKLVREQLASNLQHTSQTIGAVIARRITREQGLNLTQEAWTKLVHGATDYNQKVIETLGKMLDGDYSEPEWVQGIPKFEQPKQQVPSLTFSEVIAKQEALSQKQLNNESKASSTFKKYQTSTTQFAKFRKSKNVHTVTVKEVEAWRDDLIDVHHNKRKTVHNKMLDIKAVIGWAIKQSKVFVVRVFETDEGLI